MLSKLIEMRQLVMSLPINVRIAVIVISAVIALISTIKECNDDTVEDVIANEKTNADKIGTDVSNLEDAASKIKPPTLKDVKDGNKSIHNHDRDSDSGVF